MIRKVGGTRPYYEVRGREGGKYGKQFRRRFRTRKEAEAFLLRAKTREARRRNGLPAEREPVTYDELVEKFLAQYDARSKSWKRDMLRYSRTNFGPLFVREMRSHEVAIWVNGLRVSPKTKQHALEAMRQVLNAGVEWEYLDRNPARPSAVRGPRQAKPHVRPFRSWAEVQHLAQCAGRYGPLIIFACATGLRPEEWIALRWHDLDIRNSCVEINKVFVDGEIRTDEGKTDAAFRTVVLQPRALEALASLPRPLHDDRLVFSAPRGGHIDLDNWRSRHWADAMAASGLERRPPYQMRHTYASLALAAGAELYWVSEQMGHRDIRVTLKHYARFQRQSAVDKRNLGLLAAYSAEESEGVAEVPDAAESRDSR